jgi:hypothetical protein
MGSNQLSTVMKMYRGSGCIDPYIPDLSTVPSSCIQVSQEECARLREGVPYGEVYRYNPKHLCPKLNGYGDNGQRKVWSSVGSTLSADKS